MLSHLEFIIVVVLLVWIIRRLPTPWVYDMYLRRMLSQLNDIEAHARGVPLEQIKQEFSNTISDTTAIHDGTPLWMRMWR